MAKTDLTSQKIDRSAVMRAAWAEWKKIARFCTETRRPTYESFAICLGRAWNRARIDRAAAIARAEREAREAAHSAAFCAQRDAEEAAIAADPILAKRYAEACEHHRMIFNTPDKYLGPNDRDEASAALKSIRAEALERSRRIAA